MFAERSDELELMDDPSVEGPALEQTLADIERLNRWLGGYRPSIEGLARLIPAGARTVRVLDVGTGSGDTPRRLVDWGEKRGVDVRVTAIDLSETSVLRARRLCRSHPGIDVARVDLFDLPDDEPFDVVHAALVLHHFRGAAAQEALAKMFALSRLGVVVNDLHRHALAWASVKLLTAVAIESPMVKNDAALSVLRAFRKSELVEMCAASGLPEPAIAWYVAFRWQMLIRRT